MDEFAAAADLVSRRSSRFVSTPLDLRQWRSQLPDSNSSRGPMSAAGHPDCPACATRMVVQRIIAAPDGIEHWTFRCARCGQLDQAQVDKTQIGATASRSAATS
jgi:hypothetical protein